MLLFILHHRRTRHKDLHFNTSHVTVYPSFSSSVSSGSSYFNTSHVTVYRHRRSVEMHKKRISIHLMLLFILLGFNFQYQFGYFNTSHVTVYQRLGIMVHRSEYISIHLMLLFIKSLLCRFK